MSEKNETITVADLAAALRLPEESTKADVLTALSNLRPAGRGPRKLSKKFKSQAEYDSLAKKEVRVRVTAPHPIAERGGVYSPPVFEANGRMKTPGDVFITDAARLRKIAPFVEQVSDSTPTTAEVALAAAQKKTA
jgi:hypothetical protein